MGILDIITVIIFSVAVLVTGISLSKSGKDLKGFFGGGGDIPWAMSGLSLFMGFFSAGTFVVWGSIAYSCGLTAIIIQLTMAVAGFVVGTFIAPRWHRTGGSLLPNISPTISDRQHRRLTPTSSSPCPYSLPARFFIQWQRFSKSQRGCLSRHPSSHSVCSA